MVHPGVDALIGRLGEIDHDERLASPLSGQRGFTDVPDVELRCAPVGPVLLVVEDEDVGVVVQREL